MKHRQFSPLFYAAALLIPALTGAAIADSPTYVNGGASASRGWTDPTYGLWHSCTMGGGGYVLNTILCPSDPKRVYAYGDMDGVFRSDDGGHSWRNIEGGLDVKQGTYSFAGLIVNPHNADQIAVACGECQDGTINGYYRSGDGGKTWAKTLDVRFTGANGPYRWSGQRIIRSWGKTGAIIAASSGDGVKRSEDGGGTWVDCGLHGVCFTDASFDVTNPNRAWLCAEPVDLGGEGGKQLGGMYKTEDCGKTWTKLTDNSPIRIVQDPIKPSVLYGLFKTTVKRSLDSGATWQDFSDGLPTTSDESGSDDLAFYLAIGTGPNFILITSSDSKDIYRLDCGQSTWQKIEPAFDLTGWRLTFCKPPSDHMASIVVSPQNPNHWYMTDEFGLYQTWDAGKTLIPADQGIETTCTSTLTQDPTSGANAYMGAADVGFWYSNDGGAILTQTDSSAAGWVGNVKCIDLSAKMPSRVYAVGGEGWNANRIYRSTDSGKSVDLLTMHGTGLPDGPFSCNTIVVDPRDPYSVYVATSAVIGASSGGVYHSTDGGNTWTSMSQGLPQGQRVFNEQIWWGGRQLAMGSDGTLLATSTTCGSVYRFDPTSSSWSAVAFPHNGAIFSITADLLKPGRFYVSVEGDDVHPNISQGGLYRTDDSGASWTKILSGSIHGVAVDRAVRNRVAAGTKDGIALSLNSGSTWTTLQRLPNRGVIDSLAFAGSHLLAGTGGNGAFWIDLRDIKP